jgi:hypothetical protein
VADFEAVAARLREILAPYRASLKPGEHSGIELLLGRPTPAYPEGQQFAGIRVGKRYVSYYLTPVYMWPDLLDSTSPDLRRRMQGKSCFNFTSIDPGLMSGLESLTAASFDRFRSEGFVPGE